MATEPSINASRSRPRATFRGFAWLLGGGIALVAALLAVVIATGLVVFALITAVALTLRAVISRLGRTVRAPDPTLIEARHLGGHSWVAYGWDGRP